MFSIPNKVKVNSHMVTNVKSEKVADCVINYVELTCAVTDATLTHGKFSKNSIMIF